METCSNHPLTFIRETAVSLVNYNSYSQQEPSQFLYVSWTHVSALLYSHTLTCLYPNPKTSILPRKFIFAAPSLALISCRIADNRGKT